MSHGCFFFIRESLFIDMLVFIKMFTNTNYSNLLNKLTIVEMNVVKQKWRYVICVSQFKCQNEREY